jgi:hypothetical protein
MRFLPVMTDVSPARGTAYRAAIFAWRLLGFGPTTRAPLRVTLGFVALLAVMAMFQLGDGILTIAVLTSRDHALAYEGAAPAAAALAIAGPLGLIALKAGGLVFLVGLAEYGRRRGLASAAYGIPLGGILIGALLCVNSLDILAHPYRVEIVRGVPVIVGQ